MERRILTLLLSAFALSAFTVGTAACGGEKNNTHTHEYGEWVVNEQPTCTEEGEKRRECSCGEYEVEKIPALGHELADFNYTQTILSEEGFVYSDYQYCTREGCGYSSCIISGFNDETAEELIIPSSLNGKPVTAVGENAFNGFTKLKSVTVPETLEEIGKNAFAKCSQLENVYISDLGAWCGISFDGLSANPLYFAENLYMGNELLTEIVVPDSAERIGDYAFYECSAITSVDTGNGVVTIGENAFYNCGDLQSVTAGANVVSIGGQAFAECSELESLSFCGENLQTIGEYAFSDCSALKEVEIPSSVKVIGDNAFLSCTALKKVTLNEGLESIGICAFAGCTSLASLEMPDSVKQIGFGVLMFQVDGAGFGAASALSNCLTNLVLSNSITEIPDYAFSKCNFSSVVIGSSVQTIRYSSFYGCTFLESIVIPKSLTKVESFAFYQCTELRKVFYAGTPSEWRQIVIGLNGNEISNATVYYYVDIQPVIKGNFWHYVNGVPTVWEVD